jgi:hypothetical protein
MAKKERNRGSVDRARAKRGSSQANREAETPPMRFRDLPMDVPSTMPRATPKPASTRPVQRPAPRKRKQSCADLYAR